MTRIGSRLADAAQTSVGVQSRPFQFGVLADETEQRMYVFPDGWILVTLGLIQVAATEHEVAAVLAESMETIARDNKAITSTQPPGTASASWMAQAGFDPDGIRTFRARWASTRPIDPRQTRVIP